MAKISVIIPIYGVENFLVEALDSVLAKTLADIEIIFGINAVVTKRFDEENTIIAGNPAKLVKRNVKWQRESTYELFKKREC